MPASPRNVGAARITIDGNEAAASVAYRMNEVIGIYPITPASPMGEHADEWAVRGKTNLWGRTPDVVQMQSGPAPPRWYTAHCKPARWRRRSPRRRAYS
jgi:hypothetical protein